MNSNALKIIHKELDAYPEIKRLYLQEKAILDRTFYGLKVWRPKKIEWQPNENQVIRR